MSKFEAELRLPCKQPYAYISVWIRGDSKQEFTDNVNDFSLALVENLTDLHTQSYDVVMGTKKPAPTAQALIESELGGKIVAQQFNQAAKVDAKIASGDATLVDVKPWERPKPATKAAASSNDPFANFK